ncbi:MAG: TlpA disulfide reductase family protein [Gammaproteobacteria bacterium]|jgi:thiol-disulfide isomerase/thioredoxin|nr:TlpA family protein disulfide reductase [Gammaproteobacteria bacterium]
MPYRFYRNTQSPALPTLVLVTTLVLATTIFSPLLFAADAPTFELPADENTISLNQLQGSVVYLDFWASWCTPCRKSFPWMNKIQSKYKDKGLVVVAVNLDKSKSKADDFLKEFDRNFIVAFDPEGKTAESYKVMGMPSSYLIDRKGQLHLSHIGFRESDTEKLESKIRELLKQ